MPLLPANCGLELRSVALSAASSEDGDPGGDGSDVLRLVPHGVRVARCGGFCDGGGGGGGGGYKDAGLMECTATETKTRNLLPLNPFMATTSRWSHMGNHIELIFWSTAKLSGASSCNSSKSKEPHG